MTIQTAHMGASPMPTPGAKLVTTHDLGVYRSGRWLIEHVDLSVSQGEIVTLIGPNGGGKTTLVKAVLGLETHDAGSIDHAPGTRIGYVPQKFHLDWTMPLTVSRLMTLTVRASRAKVLAALEETGVAQLAGSAVQFLSGGEMQRVLIARALLREPDLLVLDEPVQGVDFTGEIVLYEMISGIRRARGCGILLVSHDLHVVMREANRVVCLNRHVCCSGVPQAVASSPEYQRLFGPRAVEAVSVYHHHHDHTHALDGSCPGDHACGHNHYHEHAGERASANDEKALSDV
ncbi:metal ABC transporter ATP-binding protein [Breoghania sp.]|uniref:metal ABC transporter ATP-binding protein n=1 Tax=Breoghania sp. TaxID=2065378 RepID=UPI0026341CE3|nr:metal ABC transporter ATP-binding protein [Breoghania sp.]MDJ0930509.1 metal ABC transporter ATP-binding protein [Breoghania sp.]